MGVLRRVWVRPRGTRVAGAVGLVVLAVGGVAACDAVGMSTAAVAWTTDQTATRELDRRKADVQWLTCTASYGDRGGGSKPSAGEETVAEVDCTGKTKDGRDISVEGVVTRAVDNKCVRGHITAKVGGKTLFQVDGLGNCEGTPSPVAPPPSNGGGQGPRPTVTVTVTKTLWCKEDPQCWPEGK
ncbi:MULTISPECIES: hypothetical protein [Streptomyces]|uniref:Lipoprotein n=1 Tax=Streptomyces fuscus TaxID=3048495 RepID=A0ABT7IZI2_9ACTN|nr:MULTISPECIES: hypothetical protein [Streptomyces]MCM1973120.1 hypothetical protein [Streptomyces sp. G1]MDL2078004.1 hypothetical protein [Streptomyces fuscus]